MKKVRHGRAGLAAAQDFEFLEGGALAQRVVVAGEKHGGGQRSGGFLAGARPGITPAPKPDPRISRLRFDITL